MIELKHGITDEMLDMVYGRLIEHRLYAKVTKALGKAGINQQLEQMQWVIGFYVSKTCVAALWGDSKINLVTRKGYENRWINPRVYKQFWRWFFDKYKKATVIPDNGLVIPFLLRMGFKWADNRLEMERDDMRMAA